MSSAVPPRSGPEIQDALRSFVERWRAYAGGEVEESQTFLNELIDCYGVDRRAAGMRFEYHLPTAGFMDMFWPGRALVEMKSPAKSQRLEDAQPQAERYWRASAAPDGSYGAVRYVVLCSFHRVLVWDMHQDPSRPAASLSLDELPDHYEALLFLAGGGLNASFVEHHRALTQGAAESVAALYQSLKDRGAAPPDEIQRFTMQCVWTMFAEDLQMIGGYPLQKIVDRLRRERDPNVARDLGFLFRVLNQKTDVNRKGELSGTRYVNGELFEQPAEVDLNPIELTLLSRAAEYDWRRVDPTIFGSLMEGVLGRERRWELGAHYTHEADILKIVEPTIIRPWRERIDACTSPAVARDLLDELCAFKVLDPACGCGNFLYVAYRELRSLEAALKARIRSLAAEQGLPVPAGPWPYVPLANMQGIDIERIAVLIARVTLWMGHRQMIELYGEAEPPLPLVNLTGIRAADALRVDWPETDCIIGNPPFLGDRRLRESVGDEYARWLSQAFGVGIKDFCVYWFRKAHAHLTPGQRAGLVGTNSIRQNLNRKVSLEYIEDHNGIITDAISSQDWPGDAAVDVSLVNWIRAAEYAGPFTLDGVSVDAITPYLQGGRRTRVIPLRANRGRSFIGAQPSGKGFILGETEAQRLRLIEANRDVVRRYLTGDDLVRTPKQEPSRWIVDFGVRTLESARRYDGPLAIVRERVKPERDLSTKRHFRSMWWQFAWPRPEMRAAIERLHRFAVCGLQGKRLIFAWADLDWCPSNLVGVIALDSDFAMGILSSSVHERWARQESSTLEDRLRYTPSSVFETFPWPDGASDAQRETAADACRRLLARRTDICLADNIGLTTLYNAMDEGAYADLKALHRELDEAVAACYGWPKSVAQDDAEIVIRLTELNRQISAGEREYHPFDYLDS